jgi:hypothetical protein
MKLALKHGREAIVALVPCQECKREISSAAVACPHCGYPVAQTKVATASTPASSPSTDFQHEHGSTSIGSTPALWLWLIICFGLVAIVFFVTSGVPSNRPSIASTPPPSVATPDPAEKRRQEEARIASIRSAALRMDYASLAREPTKYARMVVTFSGKVIQVIENGSDVHLRVNVTKDDRLDMWNDTMLVSYQRRSGVEPRILDNDIVRFYGTYQGIMSYTAVLGQTIQIPHVMAAVLENLTAPPAIQDKPRIPWDEAIVQCTLIQEAPKRDNCLNEAFRQYGR